MRKIFAQEIEKHMQKNKDIWVVVGDLGYRMWDDVKVRFPDRFINVGSAEMSMVDVCVGLALKGKIPIAYSITSFLLYRPFEAIRNYLHNEKINVKIIGSGRDKDYHDYGFSHWAEEDRKIFKILDNIEAYWPETKNEIPSLVEKMFRSHKPFYINLKRFSQ